MTLGRRLSRLLPLVLTIASPAARAAPADDPAAFVRAVYARYGTKGPGVGTEAKGGQLFYSRAFLDAFARDSRQANGEVGTIDYDPICVCQDYTLKVKALTVESAADSTAVVRAAFVNLGQAETVTLHLVRTPEGWRIDDLGSKETRSVRALLAKAAK